MPIHRTGSSLLPLSVYAVVFVDFWPDVTDKGQKVIQDLIPVLPEVGLEDGHLLLGVLLHFSAAAAVGSQSRSLLGLELLLPLQAVLFDFSLGFFFGLLQPSVLSCQQITSKFRVFLTMLAAHEVPVSGIKPSPVTRATAVAMDPLTTRPPRNFFKVQF